MLHVRTALLIPAAVVAHGGAASAQTPPEGLSPAEWADVQTATAADAAGKAPVAAATGPAGPAAMNPALSFVLDASLAWFSDDEPLQGGAHDPQKTGFNFQQLEAAISSAVDPYFRFDAFLVFSQIGVEVEEAYATTLALPANLQLRAGQFLTRFGRLNATHPHTWDFADQPLALSRVMGGEGNRGLGIELSWLAPLPWYVEVLGSATDAAGEGTARSFYGPRDLGVRGPLDVQLTGALKQFFPFTDDWSLSWGLSFAGGPNATGHDNRSEIYGTDLYLRYRPVAGARPTTVTLQTEWFYRRRQVPYDVLSDLNGYAAAGWRFALRWSAAVRYELGTPPRDRDGEIVPDDLDPFWTEDRHRASAVLGFAPSEFSRLRLQVSVDVPRWRADPGWSAFLVAEFAVGAHGAHPF